MKKSYVASIVLIVLSIIAFGRSCCDNDETTSTPSSIEVLRVAAADSSESSKVEADYVCNGVDDQVTIMNAIEALPSNGGKVELMEGTFRTRDTIYIEGKNNLTIEGQGEGTIIRMGDAVVSAVVGAINSGQKEITVKDASGFILGHNIYVGGSANQRHEGYACLADDGESLTIDSIEGNVITCITELENAYYGSEPVRTILDLLYVEDCDDMKLLNVAFDGNQANQTPCGCDLFQNMVRFSNSDDIEIARCYVSEGVYNHIMLHPGPCLRANIHDNTVAIIGSSKREWQTRGIIVSGGASDSIITGNTIVSTGETSGWTGIYNVGTNIVSFLNNDIEGFRHGIFLNGPCGDNVIDGNRIVNSTRNGIYLDTGGTHLTVINNEVIDSGKHGIYSEQSDNVVIEDNTVTDSGRDGIHLVATDSSSIVGNVIRAESRSMQYGIYGDEESDDLIVTENELINIDTPGILLLGTGNMVHDNDIR